MLHGLFWRTSFWLLVLGTLWLSLVPAAQIPSAFNFWDKAQHASAFAALAYFGLRAYPKRTLVVLCGLVLFGAGIEIAQWFTGWRFGDWQDWVADCVGLSAGYAAWRLVQALLSPNRTR